MFKILLFALLVAIFIFTVQYFFPFLIHSAIWQIFIFLTALTLVGHLLIERLSKITKEYFALAFLGTMVVRLLVSAGFIALFTFKKIPYLFLFVGNFLLLYFFFLGFEIYVLVANLRRNSQS
jgi:hypothetical protein